MVEYVRDPLSPGMCGEDVRYFQEGLRILGYDNVPMNGVFGAETEAAYREMLIANLLRDFDRETQRESTERSESHSEMEAQKEQILRDRYPDADDQTIQGWVESQSPWRFDSREAYERHLRTDPNSLPPDVFSGGMDEFYFAAEPRYGELKDEFKPWDKRVGWDDYEKTDKPPPGSDSCLIADQGGARNPIADLALYEEVRRRLPAEFDDQRAAEATLRAMQDGIRTPEKLQDVVVANDRIFVIGTVPGFRGVVDLNQAPLSSTEIDRQFAALPQQVQTEQLAMRQAMVIG